MEYRPPYLDLARSGELDERVEALNKMLERCDLCPRNCGVNRLAGEVGFCKAGAKAKVSSYNPHFGEEAPLVGVGGSGTIFMTRCNLACVFCQNYDVSHEGRGYEVSAEELAVMMLTLQEKGCGNINFVTPTHFVPQIVEGVAEAVRLGLEVPLVYNCGGYESVETLKLLDGIVDIYMPDAKYSDPEVAARLSGAPDYPERMFEALREMHSQVGDLKMETMEADTWKGAELVPVAVRGLLVRHLVLPEGMAGTGNIMRFLADELSVDTYVNVMAQYRPCYEADTVDGLNRGITGEEYREAVCIARGAGLHRLDR